MTTPTTREVVRPPLPGVSVAVLESLFQHRLLSTTQVHALHTPGTSLRWTQRLLHDLTVRGLVGWVHHCGPSKLWYLTPDGATAVGTLPTRTEPRRKIPTPEQAGGPLRAHTLAVNDVGITFVQAARERGDSCGPLSWRHEIAHPIGQSPGRRGGEQLIADALISYLRTDEGDGGAVLEQRFVELDRGTMPVHALAAKVGRYTRLYRHPYPDGQRPLWRRDYPAFPGVLVVLTGHPPAALARRRQTTIALCLRYREATRDRGVAVSFCLLEDLLDQGPFGSVFLSLDDPQHWTTWLGDDPTTSTAEATDQADREPAA